MRRRGGAAWLGERHSLVVEAGLVAGLYGLYETGRGLVVGDPAVAVRHAQEVASRERSLHVFVEGRVQDAAAAPPGSSGRSESSTRRSSAGTSSVTAGGACSASWAASTRCSCCS